MTKIVNDVRVWRGASLVLIIGLLFGAFGARIAAQSRSANPPGSLILRGTPSQNKPAGLDATSTNSPEHFLGLTIEAAMQTNGYAHILRHFDFESFALRYASSLPTTDETKQRLYSASKENAAWRNQIARDVVDDVVGRPVRFLGVRLLGMETVCLFREIDGPAPVKARAGRINPRVYIAYVTRRPPSGTVIFVDVHRFACGEMLSDIVRRATVLELAKNSLVVGPVNDEDKALLSALGELKIFESRCRYGRFHLIKEAYDKLPPKLQDNRALLYRYATSGVRSIDDILVPVEKWRRLYPDDPTPELIVLNFYWDLYRGPRYLPEGTGKGIYTAAGWSVQEEEAVTAAVRRANVWFGDAAMELQLADYYGTARPKNARPLLRQALQRFPLERATFSALLSIDLANTNFTGVADTLNTLEIAFHTNLTTMVEASHEYSAFRKSYQFKKWQRKSLVQSSVKNSK